MRLSLTALSAGVGAVAMSLTVGAGVASADPVDANFLAAPPPQRAAMAAQLQAVPGAAQYIGLVESVAGSCNNY